MTTTYTFPSLQDVAVVQIEFLVPALGRVGDVLGRSEVLGRVTEAGTQLVPARVHPSTVPSLPKIRKKEDKCLIKRSKGVGQFSLFYIDVVMFLSKQL